MILPTLGRARQRVKIQPGCATQGLDYAATLDIPFVFSSNGDGFVFHDRTGRSVLIEADLGLDAFPSPADLWARYRTWKGLDANAEQIVLQDYFDDGSGKAPRYYQVNAVNAAIEAIAERGDPSLKRKVEFSFFDANAHVRYTAAAAVIRLSAIEENSKAAKKR